MTATRALRAFDVRGASGGSRAPAGSGSSSGAGVSLRAGTSAASCAVTDGAMASRSGGDRSRSASAGPAGPAPGSLARVRVRFAKLGKVRWTSHRDVARMWERALRRAGLPVAYSGGVSPHPLLSFGLALPTGCESTAEYLDIALDPARAGLGTSKRPAPRATTTHDEPHGAHEQPWSYAPSEQSHVEEWTGQVAEAFAGTSSPLFPDGIEVIGAAALAPGAPSLQQAVVACTWEVDVLAGDPEVDVAEHVAQVMSASSLPVRRERKGRQVEDDLRPSLLAMAVDAGEAPGPPVLRVETATRPRGVRPSELADVLALRLGRAVRTHQWIEIDGGRAEPIVAGPPRAATPGGGAL